MDKMANYKKVETLKWSSKIHYSSFTPGGDHQTKGSKFKKVFKKLQA